nr:unnamed protein product [Leishmania braziliensis]
MTAYSLSHADRVSGACNEDSEEDDEVDDYTQAVLTHSSGSPTIVARPTSRAAASTSPSAASEAYERVAATTSASDAPRTRVNPAAQRESGFPNAQELTRIAQARYGAPPVRLLLKLWSFLSVDAVVGGYQVADVFGDDVLRCHFGEQNNSATVTKQLPFVPSLETTTLAGTLSTGISAASVRIPALRVLFRCSCTLLENMPRCQRYPRSSAPLILWTVFVDPQLPANLE